MTLDKKSKVILLSANLILYTTRCSFFEVKIEKNPICRSSIRFFREIRTDVHQYKKICSVCRIYFFYVYGLNADSAAKIRNNRGRLHTVMTIALLLVASNDCESVYGKRTFNRRRVSSLIRKSVRKSEI